MIEAAMNMQICSGCSACSAVCSRNAIEMKPDVEGFQYPTVNLKKCINCNLCIKKCPVLNFDKNHTSNDNHISTIAYRSFSNKREMSSSGGVFYDLAYNWLNSGGVVVGAAFDDEYKLSHRIIREVDEIDPLIGSKYLQSDITNLYDAIKLQLNDKKVLFFGMTCQVEGLMAFIGENKNLYCVDLICMGIPSPLVWELYLNTFFNKKSIETINFKDKHFGWHKFSLVINSKGTVHREVGFDNNYFQCMFKGYSIRPSCFRCRFKNENKISDITIADCWGIEKYLPDMDDNRGTSMVISHSAKGEELIRKLGFTGDVEEFDYQNVLKYNSNYQSCTVPVGNRKIFFALLLTFPKMAFWIFGQNPQKSILAKVMRKLKI